MKKRIFGEAPKMTCAFADLTRDPLTSSLLGAEVKRVGMPAVNVSFKGLKADDDDDIARRYQDIDAPLDTQSTVVLRDHNS